MKHKYIPGFTIVELLIVIVVIGILAAITTFAYNGISDRAKIAVTKSDLANSYKQLLSKVTTDPTGNYPADLTAAGLTASSGVAYQYSVNNSVTPKTFCLTATNGSTVNYFISNAASSPQDGLCAGHVAAGTPTCATGYVLVPGNATFGTTDFCVMKYEAKDNSGVATSVAAGLPWGTISQTSAITTAAAACTGCHLITDAEWMTIANNVMGVGSNWSSGTVGTGYMYRGQSDAAPNNLVAAGTTDSDGYANTGDTTGDQRRTLTLSNGQVVWDLSGNAYEWTTTTVTSGNFPGRTDDISNSWKEYTDSGLIWRGLATNTRPVNVYPGAGTWGTAQGIGAIATKYTETVTRAAFRGGSYGSMQYAGILSVSLGSSPSATSSAIGFRVVRSPN